MTAPATTDPRVHRVETTGKADEVWTTDYGYWTFERYGDGWCALAGQFRRPSKGNPYASLDEAIATALGDPQ
jgi:hypothetical protein